MSKYTTEIRYIIESGYDLDMKNYPIFDESYRTILNNKIINHYFFREIGLETVGRFKMKLNIKLNEVLPYYNKLYESELINIEPLTRLDYSEQYDWDKTQNTQRDLNIVDSNTTQGEEDFETDVTSNNTSNNIMNNTNNSKNKGAESDTPSKSLEWVDLENDMYASKVNIGEQEDTGESTSSSIVEDIGNSIGNTKNLIQNDRESSNDETFSLTDTESYLKHHFGNNAVRTDSEMLQEFRSTFLNIDMMIINELEELFLQIW